MADNAKLFNDILECLNGSYSLDDGETFFDGQSISYLMERLRDKGWKLPSPAFFEDEIKALGFKIVRARPKKAWSKNPKACRAPCNVVTI